MRVLVTQDIDPAGLELLAGAGLDVDVRHGASPIPRSELLARVEGCRGLLSMLTDRVDGEVMDAGPLTVVANCAVGVDNIDLASARERGVIVTNTPDVLTDATADLAMALMLGAARRLVEADRFVRDGRFRGWGFTLLQGADLRGARLGIVGLGRIGRAVGRRAEAFGMEVVHHSKSGGIPLDELLATSDFVSLHCPLTPETYHLLGEPELRVMKPTAVLVNTARGAVIDEAALARALCEGWIAAAGLDTFENEPQVHPALLELPNVILAPHIGSATFRSRRRMAEMAARNLVIALRGEDPPDRVA